MKTRHDKNGKRLHMIKVEVMLVAPPFVGTDEEAHKYGKELELKMAKIHDEQFEGFGGGIEVDVLDPVAAIREMVAAKVRAQKEQAEGAGAEPVINT